MNFIVFEKMGTTEHYIGEPISDLRIRPVRHIIRSDKIVEVDVIDIEELQNQYFYLIYINRSGNTVKSRVYGDVTKLDKLLKEGGTLECSDEQYVKTHNRYCDYLEGKA